LENNERKAELYNRANQYRKNNLFDRAADVYNSMVKEFLNEAEAYWGLVLCRYGIEYVEDPKTKK
jgi:lipopolysaccharide biosynthesis regulator YciM